MLESFVDEANVSVKKNKCSYKGLQTFVVKEAFGAMKTIKLHGSKNTTLGVEDKARTSKCQIVD